MGILKKKTTEKKEEKAPKVAKETKAEPKKKEKVAKAAPVSSNKRVLLAAHVSEKAAGVEASGTYTFKVSLDATKINIKREVLAHYGVLPTDVRVMNYEGKRKRFGRSQGRRSDWKKAIVTLPKGKTIDIHSGI